MNGAKGGANARFFGTVHTSSLPTYPPPSTAYIASYLQSGAQLSGSLEEQLCGKNNPEGFNINDGAFEERKHGDG